MARPTRADRQAQHSAKKARRARTPLERTSVEFDTWRRRIKELPATYADQLADAMTTHLRQEIRKLQPRGGDQ